MFEVGKVVKTFITKKNNEVIIRYPKKEDLDELLRFINEMSAEDTYITFSGEVVTREEEEKWLDKVFKELEKNDGRHLYAFIDNVLVGNCGVTRRAKRHEHMGRIGVTVAKAYREEGIGSVLFEQILEEAKGLGFTIVDLKVYGTNDKAYNLYKKFGFTEAGRVPNAVRYKDGFIDEIWMYKTLSSETDGILVE